MKPVVAFLGALSFVAAAWWCVYVLLHAVGIEVSVYHVPAVVTGVIILGWAWRLSDMLRDRE